MPQISRTLEYRRARFNEAGQNLEELVRAAWALFPNHTDRSVPRAGGGIFTGLMSRDDGEDGFALHVARYYNGQGVGIIPMIPAPAADLGEREPAPDENYLNLDFFAFIKGNHVVCLNCGRNGGALRNYLAALIKKAELPPEAQTFELIRVGNPDKIAIIDAVGVRSVDLKLDISEAGAAELLEGDAGYWQTTKSKFGEFFRALTERDQELQQLRQAEKGSITISINVGKGDLQPAKAGLDHLAEEIAEDEEADGYTIHLRDGATIRPDEVSVKKQVRIEAHANSVNRFQAWDAMRTYMQELEDVGQLGV